MPDDLTEADLARLEAVDRAASPGPWLADMGDVMADGGDVLLASLNEGCLEADDPRLLADSYLIAEARNALPALIAAARELQAVRCWARAVITAHREAEFRVPEALRDAIERASGTAWRPCPHERGLEELRAVLADRLREVGSTLEELERLRAVEARAKEQLAEARLKCAEAVEAEDGAKSAFHRNRAWALKRVLDGGRDA